MFRLGRVFKLLLVLALVTVAVMVLVKMGWVPTSWGPPQKSGGPLATSITGTTPLEKVMSMEKLLNEKPENSFLNVYFVDYNSQSHVWSYVVVLRKKNVLGEFGPEQEGSQAQQEQAARREIFWGVMRELFVNTAKWDTTAQGIAVITTMPVAVVDRQFGLPVQGYLYQTDSAGMINIAAYPANWAVYVNIKNPQRLFSISDEVLGLILERAAQSAPQNNPNGGVSNGNGQKNGNGTVPSPAK